MFAKQRIERLLDRLPIEKYSEVADFLEFLLAKKEPELLLPEEDELRYMQLLRSSERVSAKDVEKRLLGDNQ